MSKLDKDFKNDVDIEFKEADYVGTKIVIRCIIICAIIGLLSCATYKGYRMWYKNADREIFKQSVAYNEGAAEFLADAYYQYNTKEDKDEKNQIMAYVRAKYPNLDSSKIDNTELRNFYADCLRGN